jgi:hypothetical protein
MGRSQAKVTPFPPSFVAVTLNPYPSERTKSFTVIKFERNRTKASWSLERGIWPPNLFQIFSGTVFQDSSFPFFLIVFFSLCATSHDWPRNPRDSKNVSRALSISLKPRDGISKPSISVAANVLLNLCLSVGVIQAKSGAYLINKQHLKERCVLSRSPSFTSGRVILPYDFVILAERN